VTTDENDTPEQLREKLNLLTSSVTQFRAEQGLAPKGAEGLNATYKLLSRLRRMNWYNLYPENVVFKRLNLVKTERFGPTVLTEDKTGATELVESEYKNFCIIHGKKYVPTSQLGRGQNNNFNRGFNNKGKGGFTRGSGNSYRPLHRGKGRGQQGANTKKFDFSQLLQQYAQSQQASQFQDQADKSGGQSSNTGKSQWSKNKGKGGSNRGAGPKQQKK
jgi:hypothetical protein